MIRPNDLVIDSERTFKSNFMLADVSKGFKYVNGTKTDEQDCEKYTVVCPALRLERLTVKIESDTRLINIDKGDVIPVGAPVKFTNLVVSPYISNGQLGISARADSISFVKQEQNNVQIQKENRQ